MGVFEYLVKPVDRDELLLTIDRLLERRRLLDQQNKLIDESMEYLQAQTVYRRCLDILSTLDFENLCEMILRNMIQATGAQGGLLWLTSPEERADSAGVERLNLAGYRGLVGLEDFPTSIVIREGALQGYFGRESPFFASPARLLELSPERYNKEALFIPLVVDSLPVGMLLLLDKLKEDFSERDLNITRTMAEFTAIALKNSRRFQALERVGLRDQGSSAYNLTYFFDYAGKEIYKARRYGRAFSLVTVVIDRYDFLQDHFKSEVCRQLSRKLSESISRVVRDSDILAKVSDSEFYVLLPETDSLGARMFIRRSQEAFSAEPFISTMSGDYPVSITLGTATFPLDGNDFDDLLGTCREAMERSRASLYRRLRLHEKDFWESVQLLVGRPEDYDAPAESASETFRLCEDANGVSNHGIFDESLLAAVEEEVAQQAVDLPERKAILYDVGGVLGDEPRAVERVLAQAERAKAFLLGKRGTALSTSEHPALTRVYLDDEYMEKYRLLLVLSERLAYAFLGFQHDDEALHAFHTYDKFLVENLIAKLQDHYNFQRQY
jgi:diguanylate cyclase (GGDEF)-like protein